MNYYAYEMAHAVVSPMRFGMQALRHTLDWPFNPFAHTAMGKNIRAACEVFENITRRYGKPEFAIKSIQINGFDCSAAGRDRSHKAVLESHSFPARYIRLRPPRRPQGSDRRADVGALRDAAARHRRGHGCREHDVYITDWADARDIPSPWAGSTSTTSSTTSSTSSASSDPTRTSSPYASRPFQRSSPRR